MIENGALLEERFRAFEHDLSKNVLIIVINGQMGQQRQHLPFVRQLVDETELICNKPQNNERQSKKYFIILVHVPAQDLYYQSAFPTIFLHRWDFYFLDTCTPDNVFHLQKMLQIISSSKKQLKEPLKDSLCDLNVLFDDCLRDFCSRIKIFHPQLSRNTFTDENAYEFYQNRTSVSRRVECLKKIFERLTQMQEQIINIYYEQLSNGKNPSQDPYNKIYQISKDILCGKRFMGLVDSLQHEIQISFTNFVSNILKYLANDYGLETLSKLSTTQTEIGSVLNLLDCSSFAVDNYENDGKFSTANQGVLQLTTRYACILQTPLYQLFHQQIRAHADQIKQELIGRQNRNIGSYILFFIIFP